MFFKRKGNLTEEELIRGCCKGHERYFKILYEHYYGKMLNICIRYACDREEAKDMVQEGFIRIFKNLHQFDFNGSFEGWTRKVMVHTSINFLRKHTVKNITDYVDNESLLILENKDVITYEGEVFDQMNEQELINLIQKLPPVYKLVFNLNVIEGFSHREIADTLGITESTSRSNLVKARKKLQEMLIKLHNPHRTLSYARTEI